MSAVDSFKPEYIHSFTETRTVVEIGHSFARHVSCRLRELELLPGKGEGEGVTTLIEFEGSNVTAASFGTVIRR